MKQQHVPVINGSTRKPLMPTSPGNARRLVKSGQATPFFKMGVYCIRLDREPTSYVCQNVAVGIDPGSKKEGFSVVSPEHQFLNVQSDAVVHVKDAIKTRRQMRKTRRRRNTPCRQDKHNRSNRTKQFLSPSTKARWQAKLRVLNILSKLYPVSHVAVEDIKAESRKYQRKWNLSFSPLQVGKEWFYKNIKERFELRLFQGFDTKALRDTAELKKSKNKLSEVFSAHCVDSWVLAAEMLGRGLQPTNTEIVCWTPLRFRRRRLHMLQSADGGIRRFNGGTMSYDIKRGSLAKHPKYGLTYIGGASGGNISLHNLESGKRLTSRAEVPDCKIIGYNYWRFRDAV